MAVERRLSGYSGIRVDLPHIRSVESAVAKDFDNVLRGLVTGLQRPYLIRGFNINVPAAAVSAASLTINVADSAVLHSSASEAGTILAVPLSAEDEILDSTNEKVIGAFQNGVVNYIALDYRRASDPESVDETAGWSPSQEVEFKRTVPVGRVMDYRFVITTNGFGNFMPLYIIKVDNFGNVEYITKAVDGLFRLGRGGSVPDPFFNFNFGGLTNTQPGNEDPRREWINQDTTVVTNPVSVIPGDDENAFLFGDWSITSLKEWMDAIMTRVKEITGSQFWYTGGAFTLSDVNLHDLFFDSVGSVLTGNGNLSYNYVLEAGGISYGALQNRFLDDSIIPGDSYVEGTDSRTRANLSAFSANQLVINSLTKDQFTYGEDLYNRRIFRLNTNLYQLGDVNGLGNKYAVFQRQSDTAAPSIDVLNFSFENVGDLYSRITIQTDGPHGLKPGQVVRLINFDGVLPEVGNAHEIKEVTAADELIVDFYLPLSGVPSIASTAIQLDNPAKHPFLPRFRITEWNFVSNTVEVTIPKHNLAIEQVTSDTTSGSPIVTMTSTVGLKPGMLVSGTGIDVDTKIQSIDSLTQITLTKNATSTAASLLTYKDVILVYGLDGGTDTLPNGRWAIDSISGDKVTFTVPTTPTGVSGAFDTATFSEAYATYDVFRTIGTVSGANLSEYNVVDVEMIVHSETSFKYVVGPDTLPNLGFASGDIIFDLVVAYSDVQDPITVQSASIQPGGIVLVETFQPHGLSNASLVDFPIYGNTGTTGFVQLYVDVDIVVISATQFEIHNTGLLVGDIPDFTNSGTDEVFTESPDNPYAGPILWDSDLIVKGIIGDLSYTILQSATSEGTPEANKFNVDGLTGTAFLRDGEVAYILLARNRLVSGGAFYSTAGGSTIVGAIPPEYTDLEGDTLPVQAGDYVKFEDETDSRWIKVQDVIGNNIQLVSDNGQPPTSQQRPAKLGRLVVCRGRYDTVRVKPHWQVVPTPDIYWIAVRRDNGSLKSKAYLKSLELELGETRSINDNEPTNLLVYTGAPNEGAINPNYTLIDKNGQWKATQEIEIIEKDTFTRRVAVAENPDLGFQQGDLIRANGSVYEIKDVLTNRSVIIDEDISALPLGVAEYQRVNFNLLESDNLTLAARKGDREDAKINTVLNRPVYDEGFFVQKIEFTPDGGWPGILKSGNFVYQGTNINNPDWFGWVLHGSEPDTPGLENEIIEGINVTMPGDHPLVQPDTPGNKAALIIELSGTLNLANPIRQSGNVIGTLVSNPTSPGFPEQPPGSGIRMVLPPNKRTAVIGGSGYVVFPADSVFKFSADPLKSGEELLLIVNDSIREVDTDYREIFGGPKAIIEILREMPPNTRLRARSFSTFGSILTRLSGAVTLQIAYDGGNTILTATGRPVYIEAPNAIGGDAPLIVKGSFGIDGRGLFPNITGGILGMEGDGTILDKAFFVGREDSRVSNVFTAKRELKTHDGYSGSQQVEFTASAVSTNDAATQVLESAIPIDEDYAYRIKMKVVGRTNTVSVGSPGNAAFELNGLFYREAAGSAQQSDDVETLIIGSFGDGTVYAATLELVGNQAYLFVYGSPSGEVYWSATIEYQKVSLST